MYGLHSHSGDLVEEDIYVSDGSVESDEEEDEDEGVHEDGDNTNENGEGGEKKEVIKGVTPNKTQSMEFVLTTSKMGLMRRGGISSLLGQPVNRTWVRSEQNAPAEETNDTDGANVKQEEEEEITDPALLLAIQQRKIEQAKHNARMLESSENAGRDPCLFSKRTAFDIRMDQIEDKPWEKSGMGLGGGADITDYFNYGLTEEDWLEYAERQITIRQELTDASKQKRLPDPGIVPVVPRAPSKQGERVAVRVKKSDENKGDRADHGTVGGGRLDSDDEDGGLEIGVELGPLKAAGAGHDADSNGIESGGTPTDGVEVESQNHQSTETQGKFDKVVGGAWGAGAKEDSVLLRLIREQSGQGPPPIMMMGGAAPPMISMPPPGIMMAMPPPNMMAPPPPPPPKILQQQDQERIQGITETHFKHEQEGYDEAGQWKRDRHHQGPPPRSAVPHDRERFESVRDVRGHPDNNYDQFSQSQHPQPNFLHHHQQPPFSHRRGPPPHANGPPGGDFRGGPDRFPQHPPPHMMRPPMGRGRGDQGGGYFDRGGPGRGGAPPPWVDGRKRPRNDYDPRDTRRGRW
ncbi:hypothetical protein HJC23_009435 [Cyclotella cryptica]|uniref:Pre-mRNA polyadenylation factor Fip1 domain-containing protein n=1 Tax=Cyclotella cryptica TaxID=29204 RepID=A0ABD3Q1L0_9STRA